MSMRENIITSKFYHDDEIGSERQYDDHKILSRWRDDIAMRYIIGVRDNNDDKMISSQHGE